jgi:predicted helicase
VNLLRRMPGRDLPRMYREQLFANEVMLLPYYIASLNIEHAYYELTGTYDSFEGLCFLDTLDLAEGSQHSLGFMTQKNAERVERQRRTPITVVIGNPPYNLGQQNENDNNKNRQYVVVDKRIKDTYAEDSKAILKTKLYDAYVKFFRWAVDRLQGRDGIICFVSNNSFIDQQAFDGMQKHLLKDFTDIYHVDLHGNVRKNPKLSGTTHNVFGIQVGVGITVAIRCAIGGNHQLHYHRVPEYWRKEEKLAWLARKTSFASVEWEMPPPYEWLTEGRKEFGDFTPMGSKEDRSAHGEAEAIFKSYSLGVSTNRDEVVYDFNRTVLADRVRDFCENYNIEVDRYRRSGKGKEVDTFLDYSKVKWSRDLKKDLQRGRYAQYHDDYIRRAFYRPYTHLYLYLADLLNDTPGLSRRFFPNANTEDENRVVCCTNHTQIPFVCQITNLVPDAAVGGRAGHCFPFYIYDLDGTNRDENITDWALEDFRKHYGDKQITKWDIFYYVYGVLHQPEYREKYAENLKRELPRIPLANDFWGFSKAGEELARLHIDYEKVEPWPLKYIETSSGVLGASRDRPPGRAPLGPTNSTVIPRGRQDAPLQRPPLTQGERYAHAGRHTARNVRIPPWQS